jgi:hypothetical protein
MKQSQFYYLLRRGLFKGGSAIIKNGLVMFNKFTTAGLNFPAQGSAEFDGASDYIQTPNLDSALGTFSCWLYTPTEITSSSTGETLIDFDKDVNERIIVLGSFSGLISGEVITIGGFSTSYWRAYASENIPAGWNYLTFTYPSSNTYKIYLNGGFSGNLANVAIWNRALSSDEINSVMWKSYEALSGAESNGLQAWYSLDDITSPAASLANMEQLAADKDATIENKAAITAAINALS